MAAAQAGYNIAAFDIFNDVDTRRCCFYSAQVRFADGGFDADDLWRCLSACDLTDAILLYGSGLEGQPQVLAEIASRYRLLGNSADTVTALKNPRQFFNLLDHLGIAYPETVFDAPADAAGWLIKSAGGSGGTHIRRFDASHGRYRATREVPLRYRQPGDYYQREMPGLPVSLLFLADGNEVEIVGFNEQWLAPAPTTPFRYGGAVGNADLPAQAKAMMAEAVTKITAATGLRGLNSMDFVLGSQGLLALEVNPRLSASFDLYDIPDLLDRHLQACLGQLARLSSFSQGARAGLIHYANRDFDVPVGIVWPDWAVDLPPPGSLIRAGEPVCTVLAHAENASLAKALVFARASQLDAQCQPV